MHTIVKSIPPTLPKHAKRKLPLHYTRQLVPDAPFEALMIPRLNSYTEHSDT
jgi:hypothetical protein